jgi:hypothetical protein
MSTVLTPIETESDDNELYTITQNITMEDLQQIVNVLQKVPGGAGRVPPAVYQVVLAYIQQTNSGEQELTRIGVQNTLSEFKQAALWLQNAIAMLAMEERHPHDD